MPRKVWIGLLSALLFGVALWYSSGDGQQPAPAAPVAQPLPSPGKLLDYEQNTVEVVKRFGKGVVYVAVRTAAQQVTLPGSRGLTPFMIPAQEGTGSGIVISRG